MHINENTGLVLTPLSLPRRIEKKLPNGLEIIVAEQKRLPLVSLSLVFRAGSARDPQGKAGLADFAMELLRRGTRRRKANSIDEALECMGADFYVETSLDTTYVSASAPSEHFEPIFRLFAELVRMPAFAPPEVLQARKRAVAMRTTELDDASILAGDALGKVAMGTHPYGHPGRGTVAAISTFTPNDCKNWYAQWIRPHGAVLSVMGDVECTPTMELANELFASWKGSDNSPWSLEPIPDIKRNQILLVNKPDATQAQIRIASKGPDRLYSQLIAARLSSLILGGGLTSRLMEAIRVNRGLTYGVGSFLLENEVGGMFCISSHTKSATVGELIEVALEEAQKYREQGPTEEEIQRSKTYVNGLFPLSLESMERLARAFAEIKLFARPADWLEKYRERVLEVSAFQATKEAQQFFLPSNWALAVVGNARTIEKQLRKWGEVEVVEVGN